jgi:hypothetical protein
MTANQQELFRQTVIARYPNIPLEVVDHIVNREAGRVTNLHLTPASYTPLAIASVAGYIRHKLTNYDALLARYMRHIARDKVRPQVYAIINLWS